MAYGLKYELKCKTIKGNLYTLKVFFEDYTGDQIDRDMPADSPLVLKKDSAEIFKGTTLDFRIRERVDFEFMEFYTNNGKKVKTELYNPSNALIWVGYNLPRQYQVPYTPAPSNITFTATDGLALLKTEPFTLTDFTSLLNIIIYSIDKIGLSLGYSIALNLFATNDDTSRSPLAQAYIDAEIFAGLNCYEVIENILRAYDAEITQWNGRWQITRSADKKSTRMLYSTLGVYETTESASDVLNLGYPGAGVQVSPKGILQMSVEPGAKQVKIIQDFGRKDSILLNAGFTKYRSWIFNEAEIYDPGAEFTGWDQHHENAAFIPLQKIINGVSVAWIPGNNSIFNTTGTGPAYIPCDYLSQSIDIVRDVEEQFFFSVSIGGIYKNNGISQATDISARIRVTLTSGSTVNYLTKNGWSTTPTYLENVITCFEHGLVGMVERNWITDTIPYSGTLKVELYRFGRPLAVPEGEGTPDEEVALCYANANVRLLSAGEVYPAQIETLASFTDSTEIGYLPDVNLMIGDLPDYPNAKIMYNHYLMYSDGTPQT